MRDLLLRQVPIVLLRDVYALAALCGAVVVAVGTGWRYRRGGCAGPSGRTAVPIPRS